MDPIRRNTPQDLNSQAPAPKRQRMDSPKPKSPKGKAMSSACSEPKLKLQIPNEKKINMPALVCMMQQHLEIDNNQSQDNTPPAFRKCTLDNISEQDTPVSYTHLTLPTIYSV